MEIFTKSRYPYFAVFFLDINDNKGIKFNVFPKEENCDPITCVIYLSLFFCYQIEYFMSVFNNKQLLDFGRVEVSSAHYSFQISNGNSLFITIL